eukprot:RCo028297
MTMPEAEYGGAEEEDEEQFEPEPEDPQRASRGNAMLPPMRWGSMDAQWGAPINAMPAGGPSGGRRDSLGMGAPAAHLPPAREQSLRRSAAARVLAGDRKRVV